MLKAARFLIELDISANKISSYRMLEVTRVLAQNRQLQIINLSWNFLTKYFPMNDYMPGIHDLEALVGD